MRPEMLPEIAIAPTGRLHVELPAGDEEKPDRWNRHVAAALDDTIIDEGTGFLGGSGTDSGEEGRHDTLS